MLGNFSYCNPTKLYFGKDALEGLNTELPKYGKNVLLIYGGGSIKKNGIYDKVVSALKANGKEVFEDAGVMPNPTADKLREGVARARDAKADLTLPSAGARSATTQRLSRSLSAATRTRGTSIMTASRISLARSFRSGAC